MVSLLKGLAASKLGKISEKGNKAKMPRSSETCPAFFPLQIMVLYFDFKLFFQKQGK